MSEKKSYIYGFHAIHSFLSHRANQIELLIVDEHRHDQRMEALLTLAKGKKIKITFAPKKDLTLLAEHEEHQGVVAQIQSAPLTDNLGTFLDQLSRPFLLVLDGVQDPHNLGACLRTANAAGVDAVIAPKDRAASLTPTVSKVASGATLSTPFFQVTNLSRTLEDLKDRKIWIYGTSEHATQLYHEVNLTGPIALVMGSEGKGLRRLTQEHCDFLIRIPMLGTVESLNVSVATGVCLFEVVRQNSHKT